MKKYLEPKFLLPIFLVFFSFIVYWFTKPPSILWIDSGTMIAASYSLGIPNPPGFPFYMMVSHIFAILPIFNVLTRLELFTIIFSVSSLFLLYKIILLLVESDFFFYKPSNNEEILTISRSKVKHFAAFFGAFSLAFSYQYWSQSQNTEAFLLTDFFMVLFIYLLLFLEKKRKELLYLSERKVDIPGFASYLFKILLLIAFLYGLAAGANPTIGVLIPGVLYVMYLNRKLLSIKRVLVLGVVFLITLSLVYSYLPIRASSWPFVNWGNPQTLDLFIGQLRGEGLNIYEPQSGSINGFTGSPIVFFQSVSNFFYLLFVQFTPFLVPFLFSGAYLVFKKNKKLLFFLISVILVDVIYSGIYFSGNQESWFILSWIICSIFIGLGFYFVYLRLNLKGNLRIVFFLFCTLPLIVWFIPLNRSNHYYSSDYANNLYSSLKTNAILIGAGDFSNSLGFYLHEADKFRPDVTPVTANVLYVNKWYRDGLRNASNINVSPKLEDIIQYKAFDEYNRAMNEFIADNIDKHPIYVTHLTLRASALAATDAGQLKLDNRFKFIPHGLSLEVVRANENIDPDPKAFEYKFQSPGFPDKKPFYLEKNYKLGYRNILNDYAYSFESLGDWYFSKGENEKAFKYYKLADYWSPQNLEILSRIGQYYGAIKNYDVSRQYFEKALKVDPNSFFTRFNLGVTLSLLGKTDQAIQNFRIVQQFSADQSLILAAKQEEEKILLASGTQVQKETPVVSGDLLSYTNNLQNYSFSYPKEWTLKEQGDGVTFLSNNKTGVSIINIHTFGLKISDNESFQNIIDKSPIKTAGTFLDEQSVSLKGFSAIAQIWGNQKQTLQLYVLKKGNFAYVIRLDLASAESINDFNKILTSFKSLHD